jgi:hypothetical protein
MNSINGHQWSFNEGEKMGKERETTAGSSGVGLRGSGRLAASWRGRCRCRAARRGSGQGRALRGSGRRSVQRVGSRRLCGAQSWRCLARSLASLLGTGRGREVLLGRVRDGVWGRVGAQWPGARGESRGKRGERQRAGGGGCREEQGGSGHKGAPTRVRVKGAARLTWAYWAKC